MRETRPSIVAVMEDNFNFLTKMCTLRRREDALGMVAVAKRFGCRVLTNGPDSSDMPSVYLDAGADAVLLGEGERLARTVLGWAVACRPARCLQVRD